MVSSITLADDELKNANWLSEFVAKGLANAEFHRTIKSGSDIQSHESIDIDFDFESLIYTKINHISNSQNWDILTKDGTVKPPKIERIYPKSKITPWTNKLGNGEYTETYSKELNNWLVFKDLSKLFEALSLSTFDDAVNGIFYSDEIKWLKKQYKSKELSTSKLWRQLTFDSKGNVIGLSASYLEKNCSYETEKESVQIINKNGQQLSISPVDEKIKKVVSAVFLKIGDDALLVHNKDLNVYLNKFCPEVFPDPLRIEKDYLLALHKASKRGFERFDSFAVNE